MIDWRADVADPVTRIAFKSYRLVSKNDPLNPWILTEDHYKIRINHYSCAEVGNVVRSALYNYMQSIQSGRVLRNMIQEEVESAVSINAFYENRLYGDFL